jgi:hypothetical protein
MEISDEDGKRHVVELKIFCQFLNLSVKWGNQLVHRKKHRSTQMPLSQRLFFKSPPINFRNLQMSDICSSAISAA